jgi:FkbM family methyltransferase
MRRLYGSRVARLVWRVPGSRAFYRTLMRTTRPDTVNVRGHDLHLDQLDSMMLSVNGEYETLELDLLRACVQPGRTVVDAGAHIGLYTLEAARAAGPQGRVIAFEPAPANYRLLESNVAANGYENVVLVPAAVSDHDGEAFLNLSQDNTGDHRLATSAGAVAEPVRTRTVDSVLAESPGSPVTVVKMDIQGAEPVALAGARSLVAGSDDLVLFTEVSPSHLEQWGGAQAYLARLCDSGFRLFRLDEDAHRVDPVELADLDVRPRADGGEAHVNLVCAKGDAAVRRVESAWAAVRS